MTGVDVVVVNYRTPEDLEGFLASFEACRGELPTTLWVVNVAPDAADAALTAAWRSRLDFEELTFADNVGYARACNAAASAGQREVVALFNADTRLEPGVLEACHAALLRDASVAVVGPRQVNGSGRLTHAGIFGSNQQPLLRGWQLTDGPEYHADAEAVSVSGSAYFVKRWVWDELTACPLYREVAPDAEGAFLPTRHYYEETFCSYHARAHRYRVLYLGSVRMVHKWHQASPLGGPADQLMEQSRAYFRRACANHHIPCD